MLEYCHRCSRKREFKIEGNDKICQTCGFEYKTGVDWSRQHRKRQTGSVRAGIRICLVCHSLGSASSDYCHYCGYRYDFGDENLGDAANLYRATDNVNARIRFKGKKEIRVDNILVRRHSLFRKTQSLRKKIESIKQHLPNIVSSSSREKIQQILSKMEKHRIELVLLRIEYEFQRFVGSRNSIVSELPKLTADEVERHIADVDHEFAEWHESLSKSFSNESVRMRLAGYSSTWANLKEEASLGAITAILRDTSLVESKTQFEGIDLGMADTEIQKILYELDRLNAEISI